MILTQQLREMLQMSTLGILAIIIIVISIVTFYSIRWSKILLGKKWWMLTFLGMNLYIVTIVIMISFISLLAYQPVSYIVYLISIIIWCGGTIFISTGAFELYRDIRKSSG